MASAQNDPETGRDRVCIHVVFDVDVAVIGGGTHAVAAAVSAAENGANVFLCAPRTYLGEDLCATLRLALADGQQPGTELARRIFGDRRRTTPLRVKKMLDGALVEAGVRFLHGCYPAEPLRDEEERLAGFTMADRAGLQAVLARVVIDATDRAWFARRAGAASAEWPGGELDFERTLVLPGEGGEPRFVTRRVSVEMPGRSFLDFAAAEQAARDLTYAEGQLRASEQLFQVPPDPIACGRTAERWNGEEEPALDHFRPVGEDGIFVLNGCADLPREVARGLLRPTDLTAVGTAVGKDAARIASRSPRAGAAHIHRPTDESEETVPVVACRKGLRPIGRAEVAVAPDEDTAPVLGTYDVVVVGGGTAGAPAAIAAAQGGASVLLVEYQPALGGTATLGMIGRPYHGERVGFSREVPFPDEEHTLEDKMEWYRRRVREAGGEVWFGAIGCGVVVRGGSVSGAVVATPEGRGAVMADVVIDATGNADLAAHAGAETMYGATEDGKIAMQGAGLPERPLGANYVNTDYLLVDESDVADVWRAFVGATAAMEGATFDVGPLLQTRERRRLVGEHVLRYLDQIAGRTYPDTIVLSSSDYDSHGYPNLSYFALIPHTPESRRANHPAPGGSCYTPYRCLLPKGLEGLLVVGLGISMERDAAALVRMQHDLANQGYAAGRAAAMASRDGVPPGEVDVRRLQKHLVEIGNLPPDVLGHEDTFPLSEEEVARAARTLTAQDRPAACRALAVVRTHPDAALPEVRAAHEAASGGERLFYARILPFIGDGDVVPELVDALREVEWDEKILQGGMAEYAHLPTPVDAVVLALARTGDERGVPVIIEKMSELDAASTLSHHRAVALALEALSDASAAEPLARLLRKPGMSGYAMPELEPLHRDRGKRRREGALREIVLARALLRCGDWEGLGRETLERYRKDLRALFARHAGMVLEGNGT